MLNNTNENNILFDIIIVSHKQVLIQIVPWSKSWTNDWQVQACPTSWIHQGKIDYQEKEFKCHCRLGVLILKIRGVKSHAHSSKPNWCGKLRRNHRRASHQWIDLAQPSSEPTAAQTATPTSYFTGTTGAVPTTPKAQFHNPPGLMDACYYRLAADILTTAGQLLIFKITLLRKY